MTAQAVQEKLDALNQATQDLIETMEGMVKERHEQYKADLEDLDKRYADQLKQYNDERQEISTAYADDTRQIRAEIKARKSILEGGRINTKKILRKLISENPDKLFTVTQLVELAVEQKLINPQQVDRLTKAIPVTISATKRNKEDWIQEFNDKDGVTYSAPDKDEE